MMRRLVLLAAILAVVALFVDVTREDSGTGAAREAGAPQDGYYLHTARVTEFGPDGQVRLELATREAKQDPRRDTVALDDVQLDYVAAPGQRWRLTARRGDAPSGFQTVELSGDVVMTGDQAVPAAHAVVRTERLTLEPAARRVHTAEPVSLEFGVYALTAVGLEANLNTATLRLESGVHGRFTP